MTFVGNYWDGRNMTYIQSFCYTTFLILISISLFLLSASVGFALVLSFINRKKLTNKVKLQSSTLFESQTGQINPQPPFISKILDGISIGLFWLGISYNQSISNKTLSVLSPISVILIFSSIVLTLGVSFINRKHLKQTCESRIQSTFLLEAQFVLSNFQYPRVTKILDVISIGLFWLGLNLIFLLFPIFSGFELIKRSTATIFSILTYIVGLSYQVWRMSNYQSLEYNFIQRVNLVLKQFKVLLRLQLLIYLMAAWTLPFAFDKICICSYNTEYGIPLIMDTQFSTDLMRGFWFEKVCKDSQICHFYATLPQDTMHEAIFNVHVGQDVHSISIEVQNNYNYQKLHCQEFPFPQDIETRGQRRIYACLFQNLNSGSDYNVSVYHLDQILKRTTFRTIPSRDDNNQLVILFGGDFGLQEQGRQLASKVINVDPHIILIGGDVSYDNGHIHCYYSNDLFLNIFEERFAYMGRVVPFILSVGNHDVGYSDYANYNITVCNERGPLYFTLFPQRQENGVIPDIKDRVTYNYHLIQNILLFGLDSGFLYSHEQQVPFVKNISELYSDYARIAHFHVPLYPSCFSNASSMEHWENLVYAQKHWVPLFDELNFKAVFENHVHQYKRTYPLRSGQKSQFGTIYFGDGSMGVTVDQCEEQYQTFQKGGAFEGLFETVLTENSEHFWVLIADKQGRVKYEARNPNYNVIPNSQTEQNLFVSHDL